VVGVFFVYEFSSIAVTYEVKGESLAHFIVRLCAVIGGIFTISGYLDRLINSLVNKAKHRRKLEQHQYMD
jgi:uncharacterized ion transporter superfamily protein YfcC